MSVQKLSHIGNNNSENKSKSCTIYSSSNSFLAGVPNRVAQEKSTAAEQEKFRETALEMCFQILSLAQGCKCSFCRAYEIILCCSAGKMEYVDYFFWLIKYKCQRVWNAQNSRENSENLIRAVRLWEKNGI